MECFAHSNEKRSDIMFRKNFAVLALLGFSVLIASCGGADEMDARIMSVFRVDGDG